MTHKLSTEIRTKSKNFRKAAREQPIIKGSKMLTKLKYKLWKHLNKQFTNNKVEQNLEFLNNIVQNINNTTINAVDTAKQLMIGVNVDIVEKLLK